MEWKITFVNTNTGSITCNIIPFEQGQTVYYRKRKRNRYAVYKRIHESMWASSTYGIQLNDGEYICALDFDKLFKDRQDAIKFCIERNQQLKIKVYE